MSCSKHDWIFDTTCPQCQPAMTDPPSGEVSAAVTTDPYADMGIPAFLLRNADNSFAFPDARPDGYDDKPFNAKPHEVVKPLKYAGAMSDAELSAVASSHMTIADRQPYLREMHDRAERGRRAARNEERARETELAKPEKQPWELKKKRRR